MGIFSSFVVKEFGLLCNRMCTILGVWCSADIPYKNAAPVLKLWESGVSIT